MRIKAFVFDLDGVIVDTARHHLASWKKLAAQLGFTIPETINETLKGLSRMEALEEVLVHAPAEVRKRDRLELAAMKNNMYKTLVMDISPQEILPGFTRFYDESKKLGLLLAVGSGSKNATAILNNLKIYNDFDAVCDGNDITRSKPDPEVFECVCRKLDVDPAEAVIFEDSFVGIESALAMGSLSVGIGDPGVLGAADLVIESFEDTSASEILKQLSSKHEEVSGH